MLNQRVWINANFSFRPSKCCNSSATRSNSEGESTLWWQFIYVMLPSETSWFWKCAKGLFTAILCEGEVFSVIFVVVLKVPSFSSNISFILINDLFVISECEPTIEINYNISNRYRFVINFAVVFTREWIRRKCCLRCKSSERKYAVHDELTRIRKRWM